MDEQQLQVLAHDVGRIADALEELVKLLRERADRSAAG